MEKKRYSFKQYIEAFRIPEDLMARLSLELPSGFNENLHIAMVHGRGVHELVPGNWMVFHPEGEVETMSDADFSAKYAPED